MSERSLILFYQSEDCDGQKVLLVDGDERFGWGFILDLVAVVDSLKPIAWANGGFDLIVDYTKYSCHKDTSFIEFVNWSVGEVDAINFAKSHPECFDKMVLLCKSASSLSYIADEIEALRPVSACGIMAEACEGKAG